MASGTLALVFENQSVRLTTGAGIDPWFVLADVCQAMDLGNTGETAKRLSEDEISNTDVIDAVGRRQRMLIVSEPGLYKLIATSRKPVAQRFDRWVRHEVLPSIRKTGSYVTPTQSPQMAIVSEMRAGFSEMRAGFKRINDNVYELQTKGRKNAEAETVRIHGKVIRLRFDRKCPCLECDITIMDDDRFIDGAWHHHHQNNRNDNRPTAMIPLAVECHRRIENDPEARMRFGAKAFPMFLALLERMPQTQLKMELKMPSPENGHAT